MYHFALQLHVLMIRAWSPDLPRRDYDLESRWLACAEATMSRHSWNMRRETAAIGSRQSWVAGARKCVVACVIQVPGRTHAEDRASALRPLHPFHPLSHCQPS
jgi:hypothetical protein